MSENLAFTDRCIQRLQGLSIDDGLFPVVLNDYLIRMERLFYDPERNLFWVRPSKGQAQVAVWMMSVCLAEETQGVR